MESERIFLVLQNGRVFEGTSFGYAEFGEDVCNREICFQTSMSGYIESLTDPSYKNQILVLTYPLIGNFGTVVENFESSKIHMSALIVNEYVDQHHHYQSICSLSDWLKSEKVVGLTGIDTRELTKLIRGCGVMGASIVKNLRSGDSLKNQPYIAVNTPFVGTRKVLENIKDAHQNNTSGVLEVLAIDCGVKNNQLEKILQFADNHDVGVRVSVVPFDYQFNDPKCKFDRLFLSNGPGNPLDYKILIDNLKKFIDDDHHVPIFGVCLGHQILALSSGATTFKLPFGNRGCNIPCRLSKTNKCYITSQNHGYAIENSFFENSKDWEPLFINENDQTNEGMIHTTKCMFSVQFHPEHCPGPQDTEFLFDVFMNGDLQPIRDLQQTNSIPKSLPEIHKKVLVLGSGGLQISQAGEFDFSGSNCIRAYNEAGLTTILINPNIATCQTTINFASKVYFLPVTLEYVTQVIEIERPDCISLSFGGQTALNCGVALFRNDVLSKYNVHVLGTPIQSIIDTEDREKFKEKMLAIGEHVAEGIITRDYNEACNYALQIGFPVLVRAAFTLGGLGSGFANNEEELKEILQVSFSNSDQVSIDRSLKGWKELEYEIVRDDYDNCISVCNMENLDPCSIHTGESIVVCPSQTLTDPEHQMLRTAALKAVRSLKIVGECNIQFALNPASKEYKVIEVNARLSRSSALASKATGYPLAFIAAKLGLGYSLCDLKNSLTSTTACFEPTLDYCVVKMPKWDLEKFQKVDKHIGSAMKSIGESMAIAPSFPEAFQKAFRMSNPSLDGFEPHLVECTRDELINPTYQRILAIATALHDKSFSIDDLYELTKIDKWFLYQLERIVEVRRNLSLQTIETLTPALLLNAKKLGFTDKQISNNLQSKSNELAVRSKRKKHNIQFCVKQIDTCAAEFPCFTNYLYTTYNGNENDVKFGDSSKPTILVLGSGVYSIGSSVEYDCCAVDCIRELRKLGNYTIVLNSNPETVSTDYNEADRLYFDEITFEKVMDLYEMENPKGVIVSMGGQIPNNIAMDLHNQNVTLMGTSPSSIDTAENRYKFSRMLDALSVDQPVWEALTNVDAAFAFCGKVQYPVLVRPSYVLSGASMNVAYSDEDLKTHLGNAKKVSKEHPVVISKFISDAKEIEVDAVAKNGIVKIMVVSEHIENAGVHSGDATLILPAHDLTDETMRKIKTSVYAIASNLKINGPFNIQFIAKEDSVKVIECNLRVSRTFPFVSKTLGINLVQIATQIMTGDFHSNDKIVIPQTHSHRIGVKVAQFSFNKLKGSDILLSVEMQSTGEVAGFGQDHYEAYLKALVASGFCPRNVESGKMRVLVSIGSHKFKLEMLDSIHKLGQLTKCIWGTHGTVDFYKHHHSLNLSELPFESANKKLETITSKLIDKQFDLVIIISEKNKMRSSTDNTEGYKIRRLAVDSGIPVITDVKQAKLFINALSKYKSMVLPVRPEIDCFTSKRTIKLPGLIDVHVHVRDPGHTYKEDWKSCTQSAIAGGIVCIAAMPNTNPSIVDRESLDLVAKIAKENAWCDYLLFVGASSKNTLTVNSLAHESAGLKMYLNATFGPLLLDDCLVWAEHLKRWTSPNPVCVHAESQTLAAILHLAYLFDKSIHICHVAKKEEIELIKASKQKGMKITCEVSPHHLFIADSDDTFKTLHSNCSMKSVRPPLAQQSDVQALWDNLDIIDCFATDHAPHTLAEKLNVSSSPPGFPGLETALPLLLTAVSQGRLTIEQIVQKYHINPRKIFNIPDCPNTFIEVDLDDEWVIPDKPKYSKCDWTPFSGKKVKGSVKRVVIRGKLIYLDGEMVCKNPCGANLRSTATDCANVIMQNNTIDISNSANIANDHKYIDDSVVVNCSTGCQQLTQELPRLLVPKLHHVITADQFDKPFLRYLFKKALYMKDVVKTNGCIDLLKGKVMTSIFYEPSTRTRCSFSIAMKRLGGIVQEITSNEASVQKGESLEDFVKSVECYSDVILLRSSTEGSAQSASQLLKKPLINAGDGSGEHPTQALLDCFTIREEIGTLNNIVVSIVGDLKNSRTVHSLVKLLSLYKVSLKFVSPHSLKIPQDVTDELTLRCIEHSEHLGIDEVIEVSDIIYMTRVQKERFKSPEEYDAVRDSYCLDTELLSKGKPNLRILHPLPRTTEISHYIDSDRRAAYFRQMENGLFVRMALLAMLFE